MDGKLTISILSSELERLGNRMLEDLESFLVELDGNLKDISPGTRIRIPLGAGSANFWISATGYSTTVYLSEEISMEPITQKKTSM